MRFLNKYSDRVVRHTVCHFLLLFLFATVVVQGLAQPPCIAAFAQCPKDTVMFDCDAVGDGLLITAYPPVSAYLNGDCPAGTSLYFAQVNGPTLPATFPHGSYSVSYLAYPVSNGQQAGPQVICTFQITVVKDIQPPVFQYCPPPITVNGVLDANGNCTAIGLWPLPIVTDNCGLITSFQSNTPCGSTLGPSTHTINYVAEDFEGNQSTCTFTVTVKCPTGTGGPGALPYVLQVFPNPNTGVFTVELPEPAVAGMRFRLTDLAGRVVQEQDISTGYTQQVVETHGVPAGLYFLQAVLDGRLLGVEKVALE